MPRPPTSLWKRTSEAIQDYLAGREVVGYDRAGNKYFRYKGTLDSGEPYERREVRWAAPYMFYDPQEIPSEWRMWLRRLRQTVPTEEEVLQGEQRAEEMRKKVAIIDEQDRLRRYQAATTGNRGPTAAEPNAQHFLQQMQGAGHGGSSSGPPDGSGSSSSGGGSQQGGGAEAWKQSGSSAPPASSAEASGTGGNFKPGTWRPGS